VLAMCSNTDTISITGGSTLYFSSGWEIVLNGLWPWGSEGGGVGIIADR